MLTLKSVGASVVVGSMALTPETASATAANALDSFIVDYFFSVWYRLSIIKSIMYTRLQKIICDRQAVSFLYNLIKCWIRMIF